MLAFLKLGQDFTLAGVGALMMGLGSALTGWAALRSARKRDDPAKPDEAPLESSGPDGE